ncbi:MAG TPA: orotidine-5'-phosphate decarboxylase [Firmicutes bacterium]|nr:orotidine-5'-phosphate decarboxylase [Bacillota bacterium]
MSFDRLCEKILACKNPTVAGLDPKLDYIPDWIKEESFQRYGRTLAGAADAYLTFNKGLIDALCDIVPAVKPQAAFYELLGWEGVKVLKETIDYAKEKGMYVITDAKRGDIGSTMEAYAEGHLGHTLVDGVELRAFDGDSLTVNAYFGTDCVKPLLEVCRRDGKTVFVLVKTSNPSSGELQDQLIGDRPVYRVMGEMVNGWNEGAAGQYGYGPVGAVVGATYPRQLQEMRAAMPHVFLLVPGYGAQGGAAADVAAAFDSRGLGAVINSSRGIMCAWKKEGCDPRDYAQAARREAIRMRDDICAHIQL